MFVVAGADTIEACNFDAQVGGSFCEFSGNNWVKGRTTAYGPRYDHTYLPVYGGYSKCNAWDVITHTYLYTLDMVSAMQEMRSYLPVCGGYGECHARDWIILTFLCRVYTVSVIHEMWPNIPYCVQWMVSAKRSSHLPVHVGYGKRCSHIPTSVWWTW